MFNKNVIKLIYVHKDNIKQKSCHISGAGSVKIEPYAQCKMSVL